MDSSDRLHAPDEVTDKIAQHLRRHPYAIRRVRKLMRYLSRHRSRCWASNQPERNSLDTANRS